MVMRCIVCKWGAPAQRGAAFIRARECRWLIKLCLSPQPIILHHLLFD